MASRSTVSDAPDLASPWGGASEGGIGGQVIVGNVVVELGPAALEPESYRAGRPMALLADDHLGETVNALHLLLPFVVLVGAGLRLLALEIVFRAIDEHHHVCILLDRPRFAKIG